MASKQRKTPNQSRKFQAFKRFAAGELKRQKAAGKLMAVILPQAEVAKREAFAAAWISVNEDVVRQHFSHWQDNGFLPPD